MLSGKKVIARCNERGWSGVYIDVNEYLDNEPVNVRYRFGDDEPVADVWTNSTDGTAIFLSVMSIKHFVFREGLLSGKSFVFEVSDFNGTSTLMKFNNSVDKSGKLEHVLNGCKK